MRWVRDNSLSLAFLVLFLAAVLGQAISGWYDFNDYQRAHGEPTVSLGAYVSSSAFGRALLENWQSEYLQFALFILATIWLLQRGSPESPAEPGLGTDKEQRVGRYALADSPLWARVGGVRQFVYSHSLLILMFGLFVASWFGQSVTGWTEYNEEQRVHRLPTVSYAGYLGTGGFWESTLQNWQSEFLAVGSMAIFAVYLRERGSAESKAVGAAHEQTGT